MFSADFNNIDRQTVLNDDDGTLTGLLGSLGGETRPAISINEDSYFDAPLTTPECLSDIDVTPPPLPPDQPFTARTSPYEWLSTAIIADCAIVQEIGAQQCFDPKIICYEVGDSMHHLELPGRALVPRISDRQREWPAKSAADSADGTGHGPAQHAFPQLRSVLHRHYPKLHISGRAWDVRNVHQARQG